MEELKRIYRQAATERIRTLETALARLDSASADAADVIRRTAHSLRGSGGTYGFPEVSRAAGEVEDAPGDRLEGATRELLSVLRAVAGDPASARILAVDDDPEIQLLLRYVLGSGGRELVVAGSAAEAEALLAQQRFDLVLLDLVLPDGDGQALLRRIRSLPPESTVPVFVLSGRTSTATREECLALGADAYFEKPFDPAAVAAAVDARLHAPGARFVDPIAGDGEQA